MNKLFDDTPYIDKNVVTDYDKRKWKRKFQEYCDSEKIREESSFLMKIINDFESY